VWTRTLIPLPRIVVPLALAASLGLLLLALLCRTGLTRALRRPDLHRDLTRAHVDVLLGGASGLLLAFTPLMYSQSVIAEVYSLNAFFIALLLLLVLAYIHGPSRRLILIIGFLFALGLTNHQSLLFLVFFLIAGVAAARQQALLKDGLCFMGLAALALLILQITRGSSPVLLLTAGWVIVLLAALAFTRGRLFTTWRSLLGLIVVGALGLSLHLYMPIASSRNPPMDWGNTQTWEGFKHVVTRGQYARFNVSDNLRTIADTMSTPVSPENARQARDRRTRFIRRLGAYIFDPGWTYSMASQFSLRLPDDKSASPPEALPPPGPLLPIALLGLLPLLMFSAFPAGARGWFVSSIIAMFFLTVVFLLIQWPELSHHDLWVKRVQYIQAHVLFACWMGLGAGLLMLLLYGLLPRRLTLLSVSLPLTALLFGFPLWKEAHDPRQQEHLGASNQQGHDFGWKFGLYQLKGANGILLNELSRHPDPDLLFNDWARTYLLEHHSMSEPALDLLASVDDTPRPRSEVRKSFFNNFRGSEEEQRRIEEAGMLAAFRALPAEEQERRLVHLHRSLPDWDYPAEMTRDAILFGGTDPGRFVPTYMVFSANVRPDIKVLTQTALADSTYQDTVRNFYGDELVLPDFLDANEAFLDYANELRLFHPNLFAQVMGTGSSMAVSGATEVNRINARLVRQIVKRNSYAHDFYFEQAVRMPWMTRHLRPHGLIFKLEPEPVELSSLEVRQNRNFWDWMEEHLLAPSPEGSRSRYPRDLTARKTFSKLRMSQAWNFHERGLTREAANAMEQSLRLYPANPEATFRACEFYLEQGDFDRAQDILAGFAAVDPDHPQLNAFRRSLQTLEALDNERLLLEKNLSLQPSGNTALQLQQIYHSLGREERAEDMAELVLRLPNLHPDFYPNLARIAQRQENADIYKQAIKKWTEVSPDTALAWIDLGAIALYEKDYTDMMRHLIRAVQLEPTEARQRLAMDPRFIDINHWTQFQQLIRQP
jgi:tetratricopeptide (TPR) repeat protein